MTSRLNERLAELGEKPCQYEAPKSDDPAMQKIIEMAERLGVELPNDEPEEVPSE